MAKLFVIAGHGAGDPGACGNGYQEAERVRALAKRIKELGGDNVLLGDVNRNYYKDNGISSLNISKDYEILELHMDSASSSAKGAHIVIRTGLNADKYDNALANFLGDILPGRSKLIVNRNDLANVNRSYSKGYSYRLAEVGFISNANDVKIFNSKMDEIAKGILKSFDINSFGWIKDNTGWWYKHSDGSYTKNNWEEIDGKWYYFDSKGYALSNKWEKIDNFWYYFNEDCSMKTGWYNDGKHWYYLLPKKSGNKPEGSMCLEWNKIDNHWYYFNSQKTADFPEGAARKGLMDDGKYTYYLSPNKTNEYPECAMTKGWVLINNKWYYFNKELKTQPEGSMLKHQFIDYKNEKYYLKDNGEMAQNETIVVNNEKYKFDKDGKLESNYTELPVNGVWDKTLTKRLQEIFKEKGYSIKVDGIVSNQWIHYKHKNPGLTTGWQWCSMSKNKGSQLIKVMQEWSDMPKDKCNGKIDTDTIKSFQRKLGTTQDGCVSRKSSMVIALQKWANNQN